MRRVETALHDGFDWRRRRPPAFEAIFLNMVVVCGAQNRRMCRVPSSLGESTRTCQQEAADEKAKAIRAFKETQRRAEAYSVSEGTAMLQM